jgi:putative ABC transport system permease protein
MHSGHLASLSIRILLSLGFRSVIACGVLAAGTAALITSSFITSAAQNEAALRFARYGTRYVYVLPAPLRAKNGTPPAAVDELAPSQVQAVQMTPNCESAVIEQRPATVASASQRTETTVAGVDPAYYGIAGVRTAVGRLLDDGDSRALSRVAVLSSRIASDLFPRQSVVGRTVKINGVRFSVVGALEPRGSDLQGNVLDTTVFVPRKTAAVRLFGSPQINMIIVRSTVDEPLSALSARIETSIAQKRHRRDRQLSVRMPDAVIAMSARTQAVYASWTLGAAIVAMIAGGIGIVAIMLITVKQRSAEIALRRALGATGPAVLRQFLFETMFLVLVGVGAGVAIGVVLGASLSTMVYGVRSFPWESLAFALIPAAVGCLAGLVPSWIAARTNIVQALAN